MTTQQIAKEKEANEQPCNVQVQQELEEKPDEQQGNGFIQQEFENLIVTSKPQRR